MVRVVLIVVVVVVVEGVAVDRASQDDSSTTGTSSNTRTVLMQRWSSNIVAVRPGGGIPQYCLLYGMKWNGMVLWFMRQFCLPKL